MKTNSDDGLYGSGLNSDDWYTFLNILLPFLSNKELTTIEIPKVSDQLIHHPFMEAINAYKHSGNREFLDKAGKCLVPTDEPFGWWLVVTKS